ncbi:serine threonine protein kinase [Colletotrichum acutatum]
MVEYTQGKEDAIVLGDGEYDYSFSTRGTIHLDSDTPSHALIWNRHLADWPHEAFRSENDVVFVDDENASALPYGSRIPLAGRTLGGEKIEKVEEKPDHRFYRYSEAMVVPVSDQPPGPPGRYSKMYEIHSLSVLLFEVGYFMSATSITEDYRFSKHVPLVDVRKSVAEKAIPDLRSTVGEVDAGAALTCLDGLSDSFVQLSLNQAFYRNAASQLDICSA